MKKIIAVATLFLVLALPLTANAGQALSGTIPQGQSRNLTGSMPSNNQIKVGTALPGTVPGSPAPTSAAGTGTPLNGSIPGTSVGSVHDNNILPAIGAGMAIAGTASALLVYFKIFTFKF